MKLRTRTLAKFVEVSQVIGWQGKEPVKLHIESMQFQHSLDEHMSRAILIFDPFQRH